MGKMLNPFAGKTLEELEVIRKSKANKAERVLNDIAMIDKEIDEQNLSKLRKYNALLSQMYG